MSASPSESSGLNLPPPIGEQLPSSNAEQAQLPGEQPVAAEKAPKRGQTAPLATPPIPLPKPPAKSASQPTKPDDTSTTKSTHLSDSDDADLIDKEWVNKAKAIVERTRDNPYQQSEELTVVKADYLKKRYDKKLKLNK